VTKELIIQASVRGFDVALLENKRLVELHQDKSNSQFNVGDIYLGRVKKIIPGLNAAFIDIGSDKDAFLHYTDLSPYVKSVLKLSKAGMSGTAGDGGLSEFEPEMDISKDGKIGDILKAKDPVLVQILKEPISSKGPRLSCELSMAGRNLILTPFNDTVGVSKKIASLEERKRLKVLVESLKPKNFGIVVRTVAEGKNASLLHDEIKTLVDSWKAMINSLKGVVPPFKVHSELDKSSTLLRDLLNDSFSNVVTNSPALSKDLEVFITKIAPSKKEIVSFYDGKSPIFDHYGVTKQIKSAFGKTVTLDSGAYLVIEHTEALHVVDVNSGHRVSMSGDQESIALQVNKEAAKEIARQLRLRDMGGIIVIDFIDLRSAPNRQAIYDLMKAEMLTDRAIHSILPLTKLNLMQITRERVKPAVNISTAEACPTCKGTGKIDAPLLLIDDIERNVKYLATVNKQLTIETHPFIESFLKKGIFSLRWKWSRAVKRKIEVRANSNYHLTEYRFFDVKGEEIKLSK